jgi:hypothetical protein
LLPGGEVLVVGANPGVLEPLLEFLPASIFAGMEDWLSTLFDDEDVGVFSGTIAGEDGGVGCSN